MRYSDLKKIDRGVRRHFHDDITVIIVFFDSNLISRASSVRGPTLSLRGGGISLPAKTLAPCATPMEVDFSSGDTLFRKIKWKAQIPSSYPFWALPARHPVIGAFGWGLYLIVFNKNLRSSKKSSSKGNGGGNSKKQSGTKVQSQPMNQSKQSNQWVPKAQTKKDAYLNSANDGNNFDGEQIMELGDTPQADSVILGKTDLVMGSRLFAKEKTPILVNSNLETSQRIPLAPKPRDLLTNNSRVIKKSHSNFGTKSSLPYSKPRLFGKENLYEIASSTPSALRNKGNSSANFDIAVSESNHEPIERASLLGDSDPPDLRHVHRLPDGWSIDGEVSPISQQNLVSSGFVPSSGDQSPGSDGYVPNSVCDGRSDESVEGRLPLSSA
uniref:Uncharacterized protein n=1 Tax=Chenopodium quinoa TaxID=63459 RepID=A0A803MBE7_CHEQI